MFSYNGVENPPRGTWSLVAAMSLFLRKTEAMRSRAIDEYGFLPIEPLRNEGWAIVTNIFLHASTFHYVIEAGALLLIGSVVEDRLGTIRYFSLFFASCLGGLAAHFLLGESPNAPYVGASAGISGILVPYVIILRIDYPYIRRKKGAVLTFSVFLFFWCLVQLWWWLSPSPLALTSGWSHMGGIGVALCAIKLTEKILETRP